MFNSFKRVWDLAGITSGKYKLIIFLLYLTLFVKRKFGFAPAFKKPKKIVLNVYEARIPFRILHQLDFDVLWDSVCYDLYALPDDRKDTDVIFDVGSNIGTTVIGFYYKYPKAKIYAFEPDPNNFKRLQQVIEDLPDPTRVIPLNIAVADTHNTVMEFHYSDRAHWSSSLTQRGMTDKTAQVKVVTLDGFCEERNIDHISIVKMDIEGAESEAMAAFTNMLISDYIVGEMHPGLMKDTISEFVHRFDGFEILSLSTENGIFKFRNLLTGK